MSWRVTQRCEFMAPEGPANPRCSYSHNEPEVSSRARREDIWRRQGIAPSTIKLWTIWKYVVSCMLRPLYLRGKTRTWMQKFSSFFSPLHFLFMVQLCNEEKGILFNPVPISSSFFQLPHIFCVFFCCLTWNMLVSFCQCVNSFALWKRSIWKTLSESTKTILAVIVFTVYITQKHAMFQSNPHGYCRWRIDTSKPLREAVCAYNTTDLTRID